MKLIKSVICAVIAATCLSSCSITKHSAFSPGTTQLTIQMSDLEYIGETEISVEYRKYLGIIDITDSINGEAYTTTAKQVTEVEEGVILDTYAMLRVAGVFYVYYSEDGFSWNEGINTNLWYEGCESNPGEEDSAWIPATVSIRESEKYKLNDKYLDMDAIKEELLGGLVVKNVIFPETLISKETVDGEWHPMIHTSYVFDIPNPIEVGNTYTVIINGNEHVVTATQYESYDLPCVGLVASDFVIAYRKGGFDDAYARNCSFWYEGCESEETDIDSNPYWIPATLGIYEKDNSFNTDAIKNKLPKIEMVATFADGTTATYKLYGEAVM